MTGCPNTKTCCFSATRVVVVRLFALDPRKPRLWWWRTALWSLDILFNRDGINRKEMGKIVDKNPA